jgi:hypothetical protein
MACRPRTAEAAWPAGRVQLKQQHGLQACRCKGHDEGVSVLFSSGGVQPGRQEGACQGRSYAERVGYGALKE